MASTRIRSKVSPREAAFRDYRESRRAAAGGHDARMCQPVSNVRQNPSAGRVIVHDQRREPVKRGNIRRDRRRALVQVQRRSEMEGASLAGLLSTQMRPPIISTMRREMHSPRPVPPYFRVVEQSACSNRLKIRACCSSGMPIPVSLTAK